VWIKQVGSSQLAINCSYRLDKFLPQINFFFSLPLLLAALDTVCKYGYMAVYFGFECLKFSIS
jgi:hypothetical protein